MRRKETRREREDERRLSRKKEGEKKEREMYISKQCKLTIQKNRIDTKMLLRSVFHTARET